MSFSGAPIDAVVLDAGGVLLLPDPAYFRQAFEPFGIAPDDETCHRAHYASMREVDRLGRADWHAVDVVHARAIGVPEQHVPDALKHIEQAYLGTDWVPVAGAADALLELQAMGFALAVVSNAEGTMERQLADHQICSLDGDRAARIAIVVDSHVVGIEKPDPRIFDLALEALGLPAERCVYVGDTVHFDVDGAGAAGLHPLHLDPYGFCDDHDHPHVAALADVVTTLGLPGS